MSGPGDAGCNAIERTRPGWDAPCRKGRCRTGRYRVGRYRTKGRRVIREDSQTIKHSQRVERWFDDTTRERTSSCAREPLKTRVTRGTHETTYPPSVCHDEVTKPPRQDAKASTRKAPLRCEGVGCRGVGCRGVGCGVFAGSVIGGRSPRGRFGRDSSRSSSSDVAGFLGCRSAGAIVPRHSRVMFRAVARDLHPLSNPSALHPSPHLHPQRAWHCPDLSWPRLHTPERCKSPPRGGSARCRELHKSAR